MNNIPDERYIRLNGTPYQIGLTLGKKLRGQLAEDIDLYIKEGPARFGKVSMETLYTGALNWYKHLPLRYRAELEGMADGSGVPLHKIAEWGFVDAGGQKGCSSFIIKHEGQIWIGRNNDLWVPDLWGYAIRRQVNGRLGYVSFGMRGEAFAATGLNQTGLWLHYNWLPAFDLPPKRAWTPFVLLTEMLETCKNIREVENLLHSTPRTGGMMIFAAEGPNGNCAILECSCQQVARVDCQAGFIAGTNHYTYLDTPDLPGSYAPESVKRLERLSKLLSELNISPTSENLIQILADPDVEQHREGYGTVYANLCNPTAEKCWFTLGGFPAASQGNWQLIPWPFRKP